VYNVDGDVTEVHVSGQPTWRYDYDSDANIIRASHHDNARSFVVDSVTGRLDSAGEQSYVHDADGRVVQRGRESLEYTALGAISRAFDLGRHDVTFHYDAWARLVVRRDALAAEFLQFFYADLDHPRRVTHVVDGGGSRWRVTELFYDSRGKLFAMRRESELFYIALDPTDSPIVVLNGVGSVVKQVRSFSLLIRNIAVDVAVLKASLHFPSFNPFKPSDAKWLDFRPFTTILV